MHHHKEYRGSPQMICYDIGHDKLLEWFPYQSSIATIVRASMAQFPLSVWRCDLAIDMATNPELDSCIIQFTMRTALIK